MDRTSPVSSGKSVLLISTVFPPEYSPGAIRPSKMAKYLPEFGWTPIVLTSAPNAALAEDGGQAPPCLILRAPRRHPAELYVRLRSAMRRRNSSRVDQSVPIATTQGARRRIADYVLFPDDRICWIPGAIRLGVQAIRRHKPSILYSTSPDPSAHLVALALARLMHLPWVAEFRDPWTMNSFRKARPFAWMERAEHKLERRVVTNADHIVVTSAEYAEDFIRNYPGLDVGIFSHLPNGFDPEDFECVEAERFDKFTIVHAGNFYEQRSARPFLLGLRRWLECDKQALASTQVLFVGRKDPDSTVAIRELGLQGTVIQTGVLGHRQTVANMLGADILLLVPGPGVGTMPGKVFEYLAARKPILTIADEGVARELVRRTGTGSTVHPSDIAGLAAELARIREAIVARSFPYPDTTQLLRQYNRRCIAGLLASVLDEMMERRTKTPLAVP